MKITAEELAAGKVLLFDKPLEWTSFDVVNKVKYGIKNTFKQHIKIGHAGTLDPLATGLLIICTGKATKRIIEFQDQEKTYTGTFVIGATRPSFDKETEIDATHPFDHITEEDIYATAKQFEGVQQQFPPIFSAVKVQGKRAYDLARKGEVPEIKSKEVTVYGFKITSINLPEVGFEITCSKGTYIRSLASDFGKKLGCGAYLNTLRRTKTGSFNIDDAFTLESFKATITETPVQ